MCTVRDTHRGSLLAEAQSQSMYILDGQTRGDQLIPVCPGLLHLTASSRSPCPETLSPRQTMTRAGHHSTETRTTQRCLHTWRHRHGLGRHTESHTEQRDTRHPDTPCAHPRDQAHTHTHTPRYRHTRADFACIEATHTHTHTYLLNKRNTKT